MTFARFALLTVVTSTAHLAIAQSLDFETFKTTVEPVFAKKRPGHARCVACHSAANNAFKLQPLPKAPPGPKSNPAAISSRFRNW